MGSLEEYIKENHSDIFDAYIRLITPHYYTTGIQYHPITNGFGCGAGGSKEPLEIISADYHANGIIDYSLQSIRDLSRKYSVRSTEIHKKLKKLDESLVGTSTPVKNSKRYKYLDINGVKYFMVQGFSRQYKTERLWANVVIQQIDRDYPRYNLRTNCYGNWSLDTFTSKDSIGRESYTCKHDISVREFKEIVFCDPNVKLICSLFNHL